MQKIIAFLMSLLMTLFGFAPAVQPADAYTQAEWYALVVKHFGIQEADLEDGDNYGKLDADDPNFAVVEACYDFDVLVGEFDADKAVTDVLVGKSLAAAANLDGVKTAKDGGIQIAIDAGIVSIKVNLFGKYKEAIISKEDADTALAVALKANLDRLSKVDNGGVIVNKEGDIADMSELTADEIDEDAISYLSYEGNVKPFATNAQGEFEDQSLLDKLNISFNVGPFKVKAKAQDTGFDVSLEGNIKGVGISKKYEVRNFDVTTKFEGNLAEKKIDNAYLLMNYDLNDITTVSGSFAASLAEKELPEGADEMNFFNKIQTGMYEFTKGDESVIPVFTYDVPIPNCPAITVGVTAKLVISVEGYVQLILSSSETKGIEIINNKVRTISDSTGEKTTLIAHATIEAKLSIFANVKCVSICLIDIDATVGLGVKVTVTLTTGATSRTLDIPCDFLFDVSITYPNAENLGIKGHVKMYGIVKIGIGNNSILSKIGLKKTWDLVNESNGTFLDKEFDIVKAA